MSASRAFPAGSIHLIGACGYGMRGLARLLLAQGRAVSGSDACEGPVLETLQREGLIELLVGFRDQGIVKFIGASSSLPHLPGLIDLGVFDACQIPYSCLAPEHHDWITRAAESGAGIIIRGGIAHGGPEAEIQRPALNDIWTRAKLDEVLPEGIKRAELILRYTLSHPHCHTTIVGTCNPEHLTENLAAAESGPLPSELYEEIRSRVAALGE